MNKNKNNSNSSKYPYQDQLEEMIQDFLEMAEKVYTDPEQDPWTLVSSASSDVVGGAHSSSSSNTREKSSSFSSSLIMPNTIKVYKLEGTENCFKVIANVKSSPEVAFDLLADIERRPEWDDLCEEGHVLEIISPSSRIQYMKTKGIWPTSPRDVVVLAFLGKMNSTSTINSTASPIDRKYITVTRSIDYPDMPSLESLKGIVRMEAKIAGQIVAACPETPGYTKIIQVADGDLKGWIPASVLGYIATKAIPLSFKKLAGILNNLPQHITTSKFIQDIEMAKDDEVFDPFRQEDAVLVNITSPTFLNSSSSTTTAIGQLTKNHSDTNTKRVTTTTARTVPSSYKSQSSSLSKKSSMKLDSNGHPKPNKSLILFIFKWMKLILKKSTTFLNLVSPWMILYIFLKLNSLKDFKLKYI